MENVENLVLTLLGNLRNEVQTLRTEMHTEFADVKQRLTATERGISGIKRDQADTYDDQSHQQLSIDRLSERVERIERRLELQG